MVDQKVIDKFRPWFPPLRTIPTPTEPIPAMTPQEALIIIEADIAMLYDGSSGVGAMRDHALSILWNLAQAVGSMPQHCKVHICSRGFCYTCSLITPFQNPHHYAVAPRQDFIKRDD